MNDLEARPFVDCFDRKSALETREAKALLTALPEGIRDALVQCFLNEDTDSEDAKMVQKYFVENAETPRIVSADSTSSITFEWLYRQREAGNPIDAYFPTCEAGRQIYQRYIALKAQFPEIIRHEYKGRRLIIDNVGSGPGHDLIDTLAENPDLVGMVHVRNIDPDIEALAIGRTKVEALGLSGSFLFINKTLQDAPAVGADILLLVGILCPKSIRTSRALLKHLVHFLRPGGVFVYGTAQDRMRRDPLCDWIMRMFGWCMDHKTDQEAWQLALDVELEPYFQFFDYPFRHHCMTIARRMNGGPSA